MGAADQIKSEVPSPATVGAADDGAAATRTAAREPITCANSFTAATLVVLAGGTRKPISQIKVKDKVRTTDPATGRTVIRTVTRLHYNHDHDLADLTVRDVHGQLATVHTTAHHRFWDTTRHGWSETEHLTVGDRLHSDDGAPVTVVKVDVTNQTAWMYDLTVDDVHTFYVVAGDDSLLVHNCGGAALPAGKSPQIAASWGADGAQVNLPSPAH